MKLLKKDITGKDENGSVTLLPEVCMPIKPLASRMFY